MTFDYPFWTPKELEIFKGSMYKNYCDFKKEFHNKIKGVVCVYDV